MKTEIETAGKTDGPPVPQEKKQRELILAEVRDYVRHRKLVPPFSMEELEKHVSRVAADIDGGNGFRGFITVLLSNEVWRDTLALIPYERRILLLPQCLRSKDCNAEMDEFGLICDECGRCPIGKLQAEAEGVGYVVLIAEGTTVVTQLLASGKVDAVIGVSCTSALERSFPHMASHAVPGMAIPLFKNGCVSTEVDVDWVMDAIHLKTRGKWIGRHDLDELRNEVKLWFQKESLETMMGIGDTTTERISIEWLGKGGHRWRPFLAACVYKVLKGAECEIPESMQKLALAVECFHKASLVHDDIEDDDDIRYGDETLHKEHGVPIALNAGDLLIGEGYRMITEAGGDPDRTVRMLSVATEGHRTLCLGQGEELIWMGARDGLTASMVLDIFRRKTAPAFNVATQIGAIHGGADGKVLDVLAKFSESLGIAYQIKDDLSDLDEDRKNVRLSLLSALAAEHVDNPEQKARQLLEHYKNEAVRSLSPLESAHLKGLLRRLVTKIIDGD